MATASVAQRHLPEFLKWHPAVVLAQETEQPLVISGLEIERREQRLVAASGQLEATTHDRSNILPCQISRHERVVHRGPERLTAHAHQLEDRFGRQLPQG